MAHDRERGLERTSLGPIFAPLDPNERLPREQLIRDNRSWMAQVLGREGSRNWTIWDLRIGRPLLAGLVWPPAMLIVFALMMRVTDSPLVAFAAGGALLVAFWRFAFHSR
jgi:hypothetical protein